MPLVEGCLTERQRREAWITPLTADQTLPLPTLEELRERRQHPIGARSGAVQFITTEDRISDYDLIFLSV